MNLLTRVTDAALLRDVQDTLLRLWNKPPVLHAHNFQVPCTNPCSIMRADLPKLRQRAAEYKVGVKSDGIRFYLLCGFCVNVDSEEEEYIVLVNRAFHVYRFPASGNQDLFEGTLLDGELLVQHDKLQYVVFDTVAAQGYLKKDQPHSARMRAAEQVLAALTADARIVTCVLKQWHPLRDAVAVFTESASLACDGLILVPETRPLQAGTQSDLYKWKPAHLHTIDFVYDGQHLLAAMLGKRVVYMDSGKFEFVGSEEAVPRDVVIECECAKQSSALHPHSTKWLITVKGVRADKPEPNDVRVVNLTIQNIFEAIAVTELAPDAS